MDHICVSRFVAAVDVVDLIVHSSGGVTVYFANVCRSGVYQLLLYKVLAAVRTQG